MRLLGLLLLALVAGMVSYDAWDFEPGAYLALASVIAMVSRLFGDLSGVGDD